MKKIFLNKVLAVGIVSFISGCATFNNDNYENVALYVVDGNECFKESWTVPNNGACSSTLLRDNNGREIELEVDWNTKKGYWVVLRCGYTDGQEICQSRPERGYENPNRLQALWDNGPALPIGI